jgi:NhaP-type Na+/H+ or K+/H+ antiporter
VLAPTAPVLSAAIVGREEVPPRLRRLLNVESGLNDGLALPAVLVLLALMGSEAAEPGRLLGELALGVALGIAVPWLAVALEGVPLLTAGPPYRSLLAFAVALLLYALAGLSGANPFLAAFAGGATLAARSRDRPEDFHAFGELLAELLKLAALLVFGALISPGVFREFGAGAYLFVVLVLVAVRPVAVGAALLGSGLDRRETVVAAWFGPKGFASVVYGLLILDAEIPHGEHLFHLVAIVVAASIVAHSSTDVPIARWFRREEGAGGRAPVRP